MKIKAQLILIIVFVGQLLACSETVPDKSVINPENSIEFKKTNQLSARLFGAWSDPELISAIATVDPVTSVEKNTSLAMLESNRFLAWGTNFNRAGNAVNLTEVYSKNIDGAWVDNSPLTGLNQSPRPGKNLELQSINGNVMAVWEESNTIYSSLFIPSFGWNAPTLHGEGNKFHISETENSSLLLVWYLAGQNGHSLNGQLFESPTGWGRTSSLGTIGNITLTVSKPVKLGNGNYIFSWINEMSSVLTIQSARLDPQIGWAAPVFVTDVNVVDVEKMEIVSSDNNNAKLFTQTVFAPINFGIFEFNYQFNLGFDETWSTPNLFIDPYPFASPFIDFEVSTNPVNGDITFIWIDDLAENGNHYETIQSKQFSLVTGWGEAQLISTPLLRHISTQFPFNSHSVPYLQDLTINQNNSGHVNIAWVQVADTNSQLRTNQLSAVGIVNNEEIIVTVEPQVTLSSVEISSNSINENRILWIQQQNDGGQDHFSLHSSSRITNASSQPITFDPNQPQPASHITTTDVCLACHDASGLVSAVDHTQVIGTCTECHTGFPPNHILTSNVCDACHSTVLWRPVITVDHNQVIGACVACHNGLVAAGKAANHFPTTDICEACHSAVTFAPVITVDHSEVLGPCSSCHNGVIASGKSVNHLVTTDICEACHSTTGFVPVISVDHNQVLGPCMDCHNNTIATGKSPNHISTSDVCDACHLITSWVPVASVDHNQTVGTCESCHTPAPPTHIGVGVITGCDACHSTTTWFNPTNPLPTIPLGQLP